MTWEEIRPVRLPAAQMNESVLQQHDEYTMLFCSPVCNEFYSLADGHMTVFTPIPTSASLFMLHLLLIHKYV